MQVLTRNRNFLRVAMVAMIVTMAVPATTFAKQHGRDRGYNKWEKKCEKFVNCHDARDGRVDGRGRRFDDWSRDRRFRQRYWNDDDFRTRQRRRRYQNYPYQTDQYYNDYNRYQPGSRWTDILNMFLQ